MRVQKNQFFFGLGLTRAGVCDPDKQLWVTLSEILDIPKERFAGLYESKTDKNDVFIPPGVMAALSTFADSLRVLKSDTLGGNNNDRDGDN